VLLWTLYKQIYSTKDRLSRTFGKIFQENSFGIGYHETF
jgi:hypothetical protein